MAITKSWEQEAVLLKTAQPPSLVERHREWPLLLGASFLVAAGLALVYFGKTQSFGEFGARAAAGELLNLNAPDAPDRVGSFLTNFIDPQEHELAADQVRAFLLNNRPLPNVGALARLRISQGEIESNGRWVSLRGELERRKANHDARHARGTFRVPLLPLNKLKPEFVVRTPGEFNRLYVLWSAVYFAAFWVVHVAWRAARFRGDPVILPAIHLLTGIGLITAVSLRDPLRDSLEFRKFAWGCALGCVLLLLPLLRVFQTRNFAKWIYTPLLLSLALFGALLALGSGPTGSDARVNLGPFQPVELIKVLLVMFLAGYFARRWEWLRELRERTWTPRWLRWPVIPRFEHVLPVTVGVSVALVMFFVLKDLGPALVVGFLFLAMFALARGRFGLALTGIVLLVAGVSAGYRIGAQKTVVDRINMWLSPWDNDLRGGDQIAHSLWAISTGGGWGSGPGMGDPGMIPAGHTDLILSSIGEEWGFPGICAVALLLGLLVHRAWAIARRAPEEYATFLAFGLGALIALEILLISAGALDTLPLSGVVSPFLSSGNTAMLANFLIFAMLLGISNQSSQTKKPDEAFSRPLRVIEWTVAAAAVFLLTRAAYFQIGSARDLLVRDARVIAEDGVKRPQRNPRLSSLMRQIPRGNIWDRNGILLATSSWAQLEKRRADYQQLGVSIEEACSRLESRHYPFGALTMQILGDLRTGENFQASNASLIEHDSNTRLQGYANVAELAPAMRYRHYPGHPAMRALLDRDRDVKSTIDLKLQQRVADAAREGIEAKGSKGSIVVLDSAAGEVLAMANAPHPPTGRAATPDELLDRARYGQYPPGSTFKLVTAMAALRVNPLATQQSFACTRLPDGRAGTRIAGWNRPIRDDIKDRPHGKLDLLRAITVSCNAYFAQLGVFVVGAKALRETTEQVGITPGDPRNFKQMLPFAAYGQGPVLTTPFKLARVAATIADDGLMPEGRWVSDPSNTRLDSPQAIVPPDASRCLARAMRFVVLNGTGRQAMAGLAIPVAGKTGTAQVEHGEPHSWFAGFAPYEDAPSRKIAFAVIVENGGYGARSAAPIARQIVEAAADLGIIGNKDVHLVSEKK